MRRCTNNIKILIIILIYFSVGSICTADQLAESSIPQEKQKYFYDDTLLDSNFITREALSRDYRKPILNVNLGWGLSVAPNMFNFEIINPWSFWNDRGPKRSVIFRIGSFSSIDCLWHQISDNSMFDSNYKGLSIIYHNYKVYIGIPLGGDKYNRDNIWTRFSFELVPIIGLSDSYVLFRMNVIGIIPYMGPPIMPTL